jgi:hypothetical protein
LGRRAKAKPEKPDDEDQLDFGTLATRLVTDDEQVDAAPIRLVPLQKTLHWGG